MLALKNKQIRVLVFHPMKQHSYKLAEALLENNMLFSYCTSIYYNPKKVFYKMLDVILPEKEKKKMRSHSNLELTDYVKTFSSFYGFLYLLVQRIDKTAKFKFCYKMQDILSKKMGKKVAKYAIKNNIDIIIGYDTWSYGAIKELKKYNSNIKFIIDYSSLYAERILSIIKNDMKKNPNSKNSYRKSIEKFKTEYMDSFKYEKDNCDYYISPSSVVDDSLLKYGVSNDKIYRCTYGTYFEKANAIKKVRNNKVIFTYVGRISYAKGVHYLLDAFNKLERDDYILQLVGANVDNFNLNINSNIIYLGTKLHSEIPNILLNTDVFVTDSLYDGFSLSILEAFSYNIPAICTNMTGIKDYIEEEKNGYVVDAADSKSLIKILNHLLDNKQIIEQMKNTIKNKQNEFTWKNYNKDVHNVISNIINRKEG